MLYWILLVLVLYSIILSGIMRSLLPVIFYLFGLFLMYLSRTVQFSYVRPRIPVYTPMESFFSKKDILLFILIFIYIIFELSTISWGIPSNNHPFIHHMDEWHQLQAVRAVFKVGTPNIPGAAHGTMLSFIISGLFLVPVIVLKIVNPFILKTALSDLPMQGRIFELLRISTLLWGIGTVILIWKIAKEKLYISPFIVTFFFIFNPDWLQFSNYFKYDIALLFWITLGLYLLFCYLKNKKTSFWYASVFTSALAFSTKVTAFPLLLLCLIVYFLNHKDIQTFLKGIIIFICTTTLFGIPDLLFNRGDYYEFFYSNIIVAPKETFNYVLGMPYQIYLLINQYPANFGHVLTMLYFSSLIGSIYFLIKSKLKNKDLLILLLGLSLFFISLNQMKLFSTGNRSLVLLPFIALLTGFLIEKCKKTLNKKSFIFIMLILVGIQLFECIAWMKIKWSKDPRQSSSEWVAKNIPHGATIGVENIPIYEYIPDILLLNFYKQQAGEKSEYKVIAIDSKTQYLPRIISISNAEVVSYQIHSEKKQLLARIQKEGYKKMAIFKPDFSWYYMFGNNLSFYLPIIIPTPLSIQIYEK